MRVLVLCTHDSARSQMAEGLLRQLAGDRVEAAWAGTEARGVHPLAIAAMAEVGIDISGAEAKTLDRYLAQEWDYMITVCRRRGHARVCRRRLRGHQGAPDGFAKADGIFLPDTGATAHRGL